MSDTLTPARIMGTAMGFMSSKALCTAVEVDLFTVLGARTLTGPELAAELAFQTRPAIDFFDALVALGFLNRDADPVGAYSNTAETALFLVKSSPAYVGGLVTMASTRLYKFWHDLPTALRTGLPQNEVKHTGVSLFDVFEKDPAALRAFSEAMAGATLPSSIRLATTFNFGPYSTYADVGGSAGVLAIQVAKANPHLAVQTVDLPGVTALAAEAIAASGLTNAKAVTGNFFTEPLPKVDIISMARILHDWCVCECVCIV